MCVLEMLYLMKFTIQSYAKEQIPVIILKVWEWRYGISYNDIYFYSYIALWNRIYNVQAGMSRSDK